jgi:hypothetical protein
MKGVALVREGLAGGEYRALLVAAKGAERKKAFSWLTSGWRKAVGFRKRKETLGTRRQEPHWQQVQPEHNELCARRSVCATPGRSVKTKL